MATYAFTVNGSAKTLRPGWKITEIANEPNRFSGSVLSLAGTSRVVVDDEIALTENGTTIFAGFVDDPQEQSVNGYGNTVGITQGFTAIDYNSYATRIAVDTDTARPSETFKARLTWIAGLLSAQGVTISGSQATGPTLIAATCTAGTYLVDVLNATVQLANGTGSASWVWNIDYTKVLSGVQAGSPNAPFNVVDGDGHALGDITVEQPRPSTYGNYDIVLGGQGTQAVTDNFTGNGSTVTFALTYPLSSSYGGVTVGGVFETLGTSSTWSYNSSTNSITRTSAPGVGVSIVINYVAQFPVRVIADGGGPASKRVVKTYLLSTVFDIAVLQGLANAYVTRDMDQPRTVRYKAAVSLTGVHPGQTQTVTVSKRNLSGTCLIVEVDIVNIGANVVQRQVTAVTSSLLPATLREQFQQTFSVSGGASAAGGITLITSTGIGGSGTTGDIASFASPTTLSSVHLITAGHGGTGVDTSGSSGIPSLNAGAWSVNNVLTANRLLIAGSSNSVTSSANLTFSSTTLTVNNTITTPAATDLVLNPTGNLITNTGNVLPAASFTTNIGSVTAKYLSIYGAELRVETLVAQSVIATIGGRVLVAPTNQLTADLASGATSGTFKYNNLANGDFIYFEGLDSGGTPSVEWIKVTSSASGSAGAYVYTLSRNQDGTGANNWTKGDACVDTGATSGAGGYMDIYSVAGVLGGNGPTIVGNVRTGTSYNNIGNRWAIGNLDGLYGYSGTTWGAAFGDPSGSWIKIDTTNGVRIGNNTTTKIQLDTSGNASFQQGAVTIDSAGLRIAHTTGNVNANAYTWDSAFTGTNVQGMFYEELTTLKALNIITSTTATGKVPEIQLLAQANAGATTVLLVADETGTPDYYVSVDREIRFGTNVGIMQDTTFRLRLSGGSPVAYLGWDGAELFPFDDGTKNLGVSASTFRWKTLFATTGTINTSDARLKKHVVDTSYGTAFLLALRPVDYEWIDPKFDAGVKQGFLAQEVQREAPAYGALSVDDDGVACGLNYATFVPTLVKGFQELHARIAALEGR